MGKLDVRTSRFVTQTKAYEIQRIPSFQSRPRPCKLLVLRRCKYDDVAGPNCRTSFELDNQIDRRIGGVEIEKYQFIDE